MNMMLLLVMLYFLMIFMNLFVKRIWIFLWLGCFDVGLGGVGIGFKFWEKVSFYKYVVKRGNRMVVILEIKIKI